MKINHISIQNVLGIKAAEIPLPKPIALIAGRNYAGKSSIQEAVRMALAGETVRVSLKKEYQSLVHEGAAAGKVELEVSSGTWGNGGRVWATLPDGKNTPITEYVPPLALTYLLDAQRFSKLTADERRAFLFSLMNLSASGSVVKESLITRGCDPQKIEAVIPLLRAGFPAACEDAKEKARVAKASWRTVTGETYGEKKAAIWKAQSITPNAGAIAKAKDDVEAIEGRIEAEAARVGQLEGAHRQHTEQEQRLADLRERAAKLERIQAKLTNDEAELTKAQEKLQEAKDAAGEISATPTMTCPHCHGHVVYRPNIVGGELQPYESRGRDPEAAIKVPELERAVTMLTRAVENDKRDHELAASAANSIKELEAAGLVQAPSAEELSQARVELTRLKQERQTLLADHATLTEQQQKAEAAESKTKTAAKHHADVTAWEKIAEALAPDGIPAEILAKAMEPINDRLARSALDAEWDRIEITADMQIRTGLHERPYALLSESEQFRADAMIAEAISHLSGLKLLVLDRFDMLDLPGRDDLFAWLGVLVEEGEIDTAIISGTLKALPAQLPAHVCGHWVENGVVGQQMRAAA